MESASLWSDMSHPKLVPVILEQVEKEIKTQLPMETIRGSYRASQVGDCKRFQGYKQLGYKAERIGPELELLFRHGHVVEQMAIDLLRRSGFTVTNQQHTALRTFEHDGTSINVSASLDSLIDGRYIVDVKSTNFFTSKYLNKKYIRDKLPEYYDQIQTYLNLLAGDKISEWGALFFYEKMTSRLMEFWFKKDEQYFKDIVIPKLVKVEKLVQAKKIPARPQGFTKSCKECERCTMRIHCWGVKMKRREWS